MQKDCILLSNLCSISVGIMTTLIQTAPGREKQKAEYGRLLLTDEWREKRNIILERDGHKCRNCGSGSELEVHHRQYHTSKHTGAFKKPWQYNDHNLITLCSRCHKAGHKKYNVPVFSV